MDIKTSDAATMIPDAADVAVFARVAGIPLAGPDAAGQIAAGASAAIAAVRGCGDAELFDYEPRDFLRLLESLADVQVAPAESVVPPR